MKEARHVVMCVTWASVVGGCAGQRAPVLARKALPGRASLIWWLWLSGQAGSNQRTSGIDGTSTAERSCQSSTYGGYRATDETDIHCYRHIVNCTHRVMKQVALHTMW